MRFAVFLFCAAALHGQVADGVVVDALTGARLPGAYLQIGPVSGRPLQEFLTDAGGHFSIPLPNATDTFAVLYLRKTGYLPASFRVPSASNPDLSNLKIKIDPEAVIEGKVEDSDGFPPPQAMVVEALQVPPNSGAPMRPFGFTNCDDRGVYRLAGMFPGRYYLHLFNIWKLNEWDLRYGPEFYGGSLTTDGAKIVEVKAGDVRSGVDFHLTRREGVTIAARLSAPPAWGIPQRIRVTVESEFGFSRTAVAENEEFVILHVPTGAYTIRANAWFPAPAREIATSAHIDVSASDLRNVLLNFERGLGVDLNGQLLSDGAPPSCAYAIGLRRNPGGGPAMSARTRADGSFSIKAVTPGHYNLMLNAQPRDEHSPACNTLTVSALLAGRDILSAGFDVGTDPPGTLQIAVTAKTGTFNGTVYDAAGKPVRAQLIFQKVDGPQIYSTYANAEGRFTRLLLPGQYHLYAATTSEQSFALSDPSYRSQHANDLPTITVAAGDNPPLTLKLP